MKRTELISESQIRVPFVVAYPDSWDTTTLVEKLRYLEGIDNNQRFTLSKIEANPLYTADIVFNDDGTRNRTCDVCGESDDYVRQCRMAGELRYQMMCFDCRHEYQSSVI